MTDPKHQDAATASPLDDAALDAAQGGALLEFQIPEKIIDPKSRSNPTQYNPKELSIDK
jgi:hypothetical protein